MTRYSIMIVDDDPTSLAIGKALLEREYDLMLVRSGLQALGCLKAGRLPDLILLDKMMPGLDGPEVLNNLKASKQFQDIPVIFLSGECNVKEEVKCYRQGASDFLEKPVNPDMLKIKIQKQLEILELRQENLRMKDGLNRIKEQFDQLFPAAPAGEAR